MLTCRDLVAQSSDLLDGELSFKQRLAVRTHLAMCFRCRRFVRQLRVSQRVIKHMPDTPMPDLERLLKTMLEQRTAQSSEKGQQDKH